MHLSLPEAPHLSLATLWMNLLLALRYLVTSVLTSKKLQKRSSHLEHQLPILDSFARGEGKLQVTNEPIGGLPRAWRRALGKPAETRPSLLFLDLPDPLAPDSASRNLASTSILDMVKENNRPLIPIFGVSGEFLIAVWFANISHFCYIKLFSTRTHLMFT
ncbi:MAG: hypothetical protein JOS17DRAFT_496196 [Linnemannia elongata]|nr:MAG: hypothetical protein JOS17DRAFT_496196 [Linnemannia elongata]